MYQVLIEKQVQKRLAKIPPPYFNAIVEALQSLSSNPRPNGYKKLKGRPGYRIRVADYRIIYKIEDKILTILILHIAHRKDVYE